jgi:hypothetical protein
MAGVGMKMWRRGTAQWGNLLLRMKLRMETRAIKNFDRDRHLRLQAEPMPAITCEKSKSPDVDAMEEMAPCKMMGENFSALM